eukprot:GHVU01192712.1.p1 GENE.GHVU01192712.1~~GHVU01192712.1.p1  ORF type:complete len:407 (+),score=31.84 GHVU01192712.1:41-1261(+)
MNSRQLLALLRSKRRRKQIVLECIVGKTRQPCVFRSRDSFDIRAQQLLERGLFERYHRLDVTSFEILLSRVGSQLAVDATQSTIRTGIPPLEPASKLQLTLAWLAGGWYMDLIWSAGISHQHFYSVVYAVMDAIIACKEMALVFPSTREQIEAAAAEFNQISSKGIIRTCPVVWDGILVQIDTPPASRVSNPTSFYSGRYRCYGVNVQVAFDAYCRAVAISSNNVGSTHDALAYQRWDIKPVVEAFPPGFFAIADAAYPIGLHLLTPFRGPQLQVEPPELAQARRKCNKVLSQCRIRSEMGFGFWLNKWRIFHRPLAMNLENVFRIIRVCWFLHNYVIDRAIKTQGRTAGRKLVESNSTLQDYTPMCYSGEEEPSDMVGGNLAESESGAELRDRLVAIVDAADIHL